MCGLRCVEQVLEGVAPDDFAAEVGVWVSPGVVPESLLECKGRVGTECEEGPVGPSASLWWFWEVGELEFAVVEGPAVLEVFFLPFSCLPRIYRLSLFLLLPQTWYNPWRIFYLPSFRVCRPLISIPQSSESALYILCCSLAILAEVFLDSAELDRKLSEYTEEVGGLVIDGFAEGDERVILVVVVVIARVGHDDCECCGWRGMRSCPDEYEGAGSYSCSYQKWGTSAGWDLVPICERMYFCCYQSDTEIHTYESSRTGRELSRRKDHAPRGRHLVLR